MDNCTAHPHLEGLTNIELVFLLPNTTAKLQPCDQGIICCMKIHYRKQVMERIIHDIDRGQSFSDIKISVLDALRIIQTAWSNVSNSTISNCFQHCGFTHGVNSTDSEEANEDEIRSVLSMFVDLQERSLIDEEIDPEEYLDADMNEPTSAMSTDEEIVDSIISMKAESDGEEEDVDEDTGVTVKTTIITKDEALMCLENFKLQIASLF